MHRTTFTATGEGSFPIDMLRYDQCFPADSEGVDALMHGGSVVRLALLHPTRTVRLTPDRWESFGWHITVDSTRKVQG